MTGKKILVLGGGFGGASAARTARALLPAEHEVTLVDRNRVTHLSGMNPLLVVGERDVRKTGRSLGQLANRGIKFVEAGINRVDTADQVVQTSSGTFEYDYLVVALGADYDWDAVPGARAAYSFYNLETARRLRRRLSRFKRGKIAFLVARPPYKCPPAPLETAMILNWHFRRLGIRHDVELMVAIPEPGPLGVAGPDASKSVRAELDRRGVELRTQAGVTEVSANGREAQLADGSSVQADVIATVPVHVVPQVVREAGLTDGKPWTPVNNDTLETSTGDVFAIGDVNVVPFGDGFAVPKAGVFASAQGEKVGEIIASRVLGTDPPGRYEGHGGCFLAVSGTQSSLISGEFLAPGGADISLSAATASGMRGKERFERDWRRFRI